MSDVPASVAAVVTGGFTNRLAAHLADVKNADKAHRVIRQEHEQKLEALTRAVAELWARPTPEEYAKQPLDGELEVKS